MDYIILKQDQFINPAGLEILSGTTALGRFIQADSIVPSPGNPQSLNRYAYTLNNPVRYADPSGHIVSAVGLILLATGGAAIADWGVQVHGNMQQGMSFFDAVYYQNLDLGRTAEVAATAGSVALAAVTVGPALVVAGGEALTEVGSLSGSAAVYYAGVHTSAAGERLLNTLWSTGPIHPLTHAQDRALRRLSTEADEEFTLCGGYGETIEGIHGRAEAAMKNLPNTEVRELMMPSWRNTGVPGGKDVDLWNEPSTQVGEGIRRILGFQGEFDLYSQYPEWQYHLPYASKTYYPDGSMYQHWAPWGKTPQ